MKKNALFNGKSRNKNRRPYRRIIVMPSGAPDLIDERFKRLKRQRSIFRKSAIVSLVAAPFLVAAVLLLSRFGRKSELHDIECAPQEMAAESADDLEAGDEEASKEGLLGQGGFVGEVPANISSETLKDVSTASNPFFYTVHIVQKGDVISEIAERYGVSQDAIISANGIKNSRTIQIGQFLKVPSLPGILYKTTADGETAETLAKKFDVSSDEIAEANVCEVECGFSKGTNVFIPNAQLDFITRQEINGDLFTMPLRVRFHYSSPFGWRSNPFTAKRTWHNGTDMAAPQGSSVYASMAGRVSSVGWSNVYGKHVIIEHHSGYRTLYGHLSRTTVTAGSRVNAGTKIGEVGSTGMSTGPHLHFSVFKNGKAVNPRTMMN